MDTVEQEQFMPKASHLKNCAPPVVLAAPFPPPFPVFFIPMTSCDTMVNRYLVLKKGEEE